MTIMSDENGGIDLDADWSNLAEVTPTRISRLLLAVLIDGWTKIDLRQGECAPHQC